MSYKKQLENQRKKEKVSLKSGEKLSPSQADPTKLYAGDLESTIYHMILNEIPSVEYIEGTGNLCIQVVAFLLKFTFLMTGMPIPSRIQTLDIKRNNQIYKATL